LSIDAEKSENFAQALDPLDTDTLLSHEISLTEGRIIHIEQMQFKLRQFSITIWTLLITVGLGSIKAVEPDWKIIALSYFIVLSFFYIDTWYACLAQRFRIRRIEISNFLSSDRSYKKNESFNLFDLTASGFRKKNPIASYRTYFFTKATRPVRLTFYLSQLLISTVALWELSNQKEFPFYGYSLFSVPVLLVATCFLLRELKRRAICALAIGSIDFTDKQEDVFEVR